LLEQTLALDGILTDDVDPAEREQRLGLGDDTAALIGQLEGTPYERLGLVQSLLVLVDVGETVERLRLEILALQAAGDLEHLLTDPFARLEVADPVGDPAADGERHEPAVFGQDVERGL